MAGAADLAITLDIEMIGRHGVTIAEPWVPNSGLPECTSLARDLGDRYLIKYVRRRDRQRYSALAGVPHFDGEHYVTPTPLPRAELVSVLNLPTQLPAPSYALLLDPAGVRAFGPRRIRSGRGIEYVLRFGFSAAAIIPPGWPVEIG